VSRSRHRNRYDDYDDNDAFDRFEQRRQAKKQKQFDHEMVGTEKEDEEVANVYHT